MKASLSRAAHAVICGCFLLSGAAGLIYQVAWGKSLGLIFGNTVYATATVLAVFMGGLAAGSAWLGRWSESRVHAVAVYGWVELGVAACGAISLAGLAWVHEFYVAAHPWLSGSAAALVGLRFAGAAMVLLAPTFLMGGTLPILVRGVTRGRQELELRVSRLYWVNTLGAVAGTLGAGFWLIPAFGLRRTVALAVGLNVLAGVAALAMSRGLRGSDVAAAAEATRDRHSPRGERELFLPATFAVVGATALVYEVCWTRLLATTMPGSTYAFSLMLGTFLIGIMLGSMLFEAWSSRGGRATAGTYALTQTVTAAAVLASIMLFQRLPGLTPRFLHADAGYADLLRLQLALSVLTMLPTATVFGFNFPMVTMLIADRAGEAGEPGASGPGESVGRAYAANTLGAIVGAVLAGFWLVPLAGGFRLLGLTAGVNLLLGMLLVWREGRRRWAALAGQGGLLVLAVWAAFSGVFFDRELAAFNAALYRGVNPSQLTLAEKARLVDVLFAEDGPNATISVIRSEGYLAISTNGKVDASNKDNLTQGMLGHLGAVLHPSPRRVLVIGFGSGMTAAALATYPDIEAITVVEIEPAVIHAAPLLESLNHGVLRDPRVRVVIDDARSFLLTTPQRYDLIISEPSNPWIAGVAALFTDEYYERARSRLAPGGMFVQWVQSYLLFPEDFRMILGTFAGRFPRVTLWRGESPDYLILGQTDPRPLNLDRLERVWEEPEVRADLSRMGISGPESLLAFYRLDDADLRRMVGSAPKNTDDHTRLEYNAPLAMMTPGMAIRTRDEVWAHRSSDLPRDLRVEDGVEAMTRSAETMIDLVELYDAGWFLHRLEGQPVSAELEVLRGRLMGLTSQWREARAHFDRALAMDPDCLAAMREAATAAYRLGDLPAAWEMYERVLGRSPQDLAALEGLSLIELERGRYDRARELRRRAAAIRGGTDEQDLQVLAEIDLRTGDTAAAEEQYRRLLAIAPYSRVAHRGLADILMGREDWEGASRILTFLVRFDPMGDPQVYRMLAEAWRRLGRPADAATMLEKGRRLFPGSPALKGE